MDFVSDQLYDGRKLRALTLIDAYTRECLAIWVDQGIRGEHVVNVVDGVAHDVALYLLDFDNLGRSQRIDLLNATTQAVLDTRTVTAFGGATSVC